MLGQNDGVENEKQLVVAFDDKQVQRLSAYHKAFIKQLYKNCEDTSVVHATKIGGQGYKPDIEIEVNGIKHLVSVKKGSGNSVHQEKTELFILFCMQELGMTELEKNSLLAFLFGDGTLDGDSLPEDRLSDKELLDEYSTELVIVQNFLDRNRRRLLERFLIYGRKGYESNIKADYLYHGDASEGVWCPLDYDAIDYLVSLPNVEGAPLSIGPLTLQVWNRNLEGKPEMEERRHSIQVKWASCKNYIEEINKKYLDSQKNENSSNRSRIIGNNNQGLENQDNIISLINEKRVIELAPAVKNIVLGIFPHIATSERVHAGRVTGGDVKPRLYIAAGGEVKYLTVFMGSGNSVHQEKIDNFLSFCMNELGMNEREKNAFLTIMYGDGTIDGNSKSECRLKSTEEVRQVYPEEISIVQDFYNRNKVQLIERFLIFGKGGKQKRIATDYIYYGTDVAGRIASRETVIEYLKTKTGSDSALLSLGSLTTQPWNRNPEAKANLEDRRHSIQIKWGGIKQDLSNICEAETEKNVGKYDGDWEEYELVGKLNRDRKKNNRVWVNLCEKLGLTDLSNVYAVRVCNMVYSKLADRHVLPKADAYLVRGNFPHELLLDNNYWLDEESVSKYNLSFIPGSGISCKRPNSTSFTYAKLSINSFEKMFGNRENGAAISLFVTEEELTHNKHILEAWNVSEKDLILKFDAELSAEGINNSDRSIINLETCKVLKKAAMNETIMRIRKDKKISDAIFFGRGVFEEPYTASFIYLGGQVSQTFIPSFTITTGSGRHKGNYTIVIKPSSESLHSILDEDVYTYEEVKSLVCDSMFNSRDDVSEVEILSVIVSQGYKREGELVIRNRSVGTEYFANLFEKEDVLNVDSYIERFGYAAIHAAINVLEREGKIIEFDKNQYISIRRIQTICGSTEVLSRYCNDVYNNTTNILFFTVKFLEHYKLDSEAVELGFDDLFYESLLKRDKRFSTFAIGGRTVFSSVRKELAASDILVNLISDKKRIGLSELIANLDEEYGIVVNRTFILGHIKNTKIYHDEILDYLYVDEEAYYQDI